MPGLPGPSKGTALHMACVNFCCPDTMQLLLEHGADIHAQLRSPDRTLDKATPLLLTIRLGAHPLLHMLPAPGGAVTAACSHLVHLARYPLLL